MAKIGFLGLGAMGSRMAANLIAKGHDVTVYNRTANAANALKEKRASVAATPREAAQDAEFIISMVTDDSAARSIWLDEKNGALAGAKKGAVVIESSTVTPDWVSTLAKHAATLVLDFIDAPVLGSRPQAEAGQLIYLVGAEKSALDKAQPVLMAMGAAVHHVGKIGSGATMKLAVNTLFGIQVAAWAETLSWLEKAGIATGDAVNILNTLPTTSPALQGIGKLIAAGNDDPLFPISLVTKDFAYASQLAHDLQSKSPVADVVATLFMDTKNAGFGDRNIVAIKNLYQT
ncbi:MAG: NAD(P)-dependent oxidoreductase [Rickettsiales bacterium]